MSWKTSNPPQDGTRIIAIGQTIERFNDGTVVDPFARAIYWSNWGHWVDVYSEMALSSDINAVVKIFQWTEMPTEIIDCAVGASESKEAA